MPKARVRKVSSVYSQHATGKALHWEEDHIDNTAELEIKQKRLNDSRVLRVPQDEPGGAGTFEPAGGNAKFKHP